MNRFSFDHALFPLIFLPVLVLLARSSSKHIQKFFVFCLAHFVNMEDSEVLEQPVYLFSVLGDSNVQRNLVDYNCADRDDMRSAQLVPCTSFTTFAGSFQKIRAESNVLIVSCLSNFIRDSESSADPSGRITGVLQAVRDVLLPYCEANPDLNVMVAPPQFSRTPAWYAESIGISQRLLKSIILDASELTNVHLLPTFPSEVLL